MPIHRAPSEPKTAVAPASSGILPSYLAHFRLYSYKNHTQNSPANKQTAATKAKITFVSDLNIITPKGATVRPTFAGVTPKYVRVSQRLAKIQNHQSSRLHCRHSRGYKLKRHCRYHQQLGQNIVFPHQLESWPHL